MRFHALPGRCPGVWNLSVVTLSAAAWACASPQPTAPPRVIAATAEPPPEPARPPAPVPEPAADAGPPVTLETVTTIEYVADGTLVLAGPTSLVARAPDGALKRVAIEPNAVVGVSSRFPGVVVQAPAGETKLYETPSLSQLYAGKGEPLLLSQNVIRNERSVLFQRAGKLQTITLPSSVKEGAQIEELTTVTPTRLNLTYGLEGVDTKLALLFDADTGSVVGEGVPIEGFSGLAPKGGIAGKIGYRIEGQQVVRVDLETGKVDRRATTACKAGQDFGNPTPSPSGELLLLTCDNDGIVLDGKTLAKRRQIPRILPGCDNGPILGGAVLADGSTLLLEGCGGEAKVNLKTGKYLCGDSAGVMGAPYEMLGAAPTQTRMPAGRAKTPPCNEGYVSQANIGRSRRYKRLYDPSMLIADGKKIALEADAEYLGALAPDEKSYAYLRGGRVVIRSLPDGKIQAELVTPTGK